MCGISGPESDEDRRLFFELCDWETPSRRRGTSGKDPITVYRQSSAKCKGRRVVGAVRKPEHQHPFEPSIALLKHALALHPLRDDRVFVLFLHLLRSRPGVDSRRATRADARSSPWHEHAEAQRLSQTREP